ncbi:bucentaur or craniofacial development-domain-containing protein [Cubamyces lactineus]|nr:bucentaur or craniofacial development-domain-containing protein [Cubamyces lactineus]
MDSDSDNDPDYVPPNGPGSDVSDSERPAPKRARTDTAGPSVTAPSQSTATRQSADEVYAAFKASLNAPASSDAAPAPAAPQTVKIVKRYRFAGEEITEVKEVPADSPEAKQWPLWTPPEDKDNAVSSASHGNESAAAAATPSADTPSSSATPGNTSTSTGTSATAKPPGKRPGPRKPKTTLAPIPKKQPAKKLSTLDKSAMDWRAHVEGAAATGSTVKDELEANRRGGGYLEKVEFLQRVEARKEEVLDASKGKRRR